MNWKRRIKEATEARRKRVAKREADCLEVAALVEGGQSERAIARERGVSHAAVQRMVVEAEVYRQNAP